MDRETLVSPEGGPSHMDGMVPGVKAGGMIYFSAIRGRDPKTRQFPNDTRQQAVNAFEGLKLMMEHRGLTMAHVVKVTMYMNELSYRDLIHEVWMKYWPTNQPARTAFQVVNASASPKGGAHFVLDVIALAE